VDAAIAGVEVTTAFPVPRSAVRHQREVLIVDEANRLHVRPIEVLRSEGDITWVSAGLESGERVITTPLEVATEGMKVRTRTTQIGHDAGQNAERGGMAPS
jgi:hypothetical protein